jgi:hypothetical protein
MQYFRSQNPCVVGLTKLEPERVAAEGFAQKIVEVTEFGGRVEEAALDFAYNAQ